MRCQNAQRGCTFSDALLRLPQHEEICSYGDRACTLCTAPVWASQLEHHIANDCPCRLVPCCHCHQSFVAKDLTAHEDICPEGLVHCPNNCATVIELRRGDVPKHLSRQCPLTLHKCPFAVLGCQRALRREKMSDHLDFSQSPSADVGAADDIQALVRLFGQSCQPDDRFTWPEM